MALTDASDRYQPILSLIAGGHFSSAELKCRQTLQAANDPELIYMLAIIKGRQKKITPPHQRCLKGPSGVCRIARIFYMTLGLYARQGAIRSGPWPCGSLPQPWTLL